MLVTKNVNIKLSNNIQYYKDKGYDIPISKDSKGRIRTPQGTEITVGVNDLPNGSNAKVDIICDGCGKLIKNVLWQQYKNAKIEEKYFCKLCAISGHKKFISFKDWCYNNSTKEETDKILLLWDYELNNCNPNEITFSTNRKFYFKCPKNIHESELKYINHFTSGNFGAISCNKCNSFAQWGIDNIGKDFLKKYWDYEKNNINPWNITFGNSKTKVWIKCQEKNYHGSYEVTCSNFTGNKSRCPFCNSFASGKVSFLDSLGQLLKEKNLLYIWSNKNKKTPYQYTRKSPKKVWWKCHKGLHEDYLRRISDSFRSGFECCKCGSSCGERKIIEILNANNIKYITQKTFKTLLGLGNGNLSYDFYLPNYNLLIEYQGEFHDGNGNYFMKKNLKKQQEHDRRKREYAKIHNIELLEIWYWDFNNIKEILVNELSKEDKAKKDGVKILTDASK